LVSSEVVVKGLNYHSPRSRSLRGRFWIFPYEGQTFRTLASPQYRLHPREVLVKAFLLRRGGWGIFGRGTHGCVERYGDEYS
jgi:hypothetical protein